VLKINGTVDWSWWFIALPAIIYIASPLLIAVVVLSVLFVGKVVRATGESLEKLRFNVKYSQWVFISSEMKRSHTVTDINSIPIDIATGIPYEWEIEGRSLCQKK
jgi:hypothetical protein